MKNVTLTLPDEQSDQLELYADVFGTTVEKAILEAIDDWLPVTAASRLDAAADLLGV